MDAIGIDKRLKYLSIGGWHCVLTYILSHMVEITSIDKNSSLLDWVENFGVTWGNRISLIPAKSIAELEMPDEIFDRISCG